MTFMSRKVFMTFMNRKVFMSFMSEGGFLNHVCWSERPNIETLSTSKKKVSYNFFEMVAKVLTLCHESRPPVRYPSAKVAESFHPHLLKLPKEQLWLRVEQPCIWHQTQDQGSLGTPFS